MKVTENTRSSSSDQKKHTARTRTYALVLSKPEALAYNKRNYLYVLLLMEYNILRASEAARKGVLTDGGDRANQTF
jgi:hypothetical protein